jgi:hypothetical protein
MARQYPFIDMHIHLFNGAYLPLHGILLSWGAPRWLARPTARILSRLVALSRFGDRSLDTGTPGLQRALESDDTEALMTAITERLLEVVKTNDADDADDLEGFGRNDDMMADLRAIAEEYGLPDPFPQSGPGGMVDLRAMDEAATGERVNVVLNRAFAEIADMAQHAGFFDHHALPDGHDGYDGHGGHDDHGGHGAGAEASKTPLWQYLLFVGGMMVSERDRLKLLEADYARGKPADGFDPMHMVSLLPDLDAAYREYYGGNLVPARVGSREQMLRGATLARESGGQVIAFGSVEPFRRDRTRSYWRGYVEYGRRLGLTGFKIYPPSGFRPIDPAPDAAGNTYRTPVAPTAVDYLRARDRRNQPYIDRTLREIITYFDREALRLFTHCTPQGFEVQTGMGVMSDPAFWDIAMDTYDAPDLWLFLGHGGGYTAVDWNGWLADDDHWPDTFAWRVIDMCQRRTNVYCGLGYLMPVLAGDAVRGKVMARLKAALLADAPSGGTAFRDKVCFGTDWSMPDMVGKPREYVERFYDFFDSDPDLARIAPKFFSENAKRYLGIT